jgi:hypothetical protein
MSTLDMETVDCIYYINLDHRTDRREQFENEMKPFHLSPEKLVRVPAVYTKECGPLVVACPIVKRSGFF